MNMTQREGGAGTTHAFGATDVGCVRDHNEDALWVDADAGLYIVADGMGGHAAGEVASAIVLEMVPEFVRSGQSLAQALNDTHRAIRRAADEGRGAPGMGSTAVVLRLSGAEYEIAWVGDSRAYLWDGTRLRQLSRDHSFVQQLLEARAITGEQAEQHPDRNVITQSLGMTEYEQVRPDTVTGRLYRGEEILLCSDGLCSEVTDKEIAAVLALDEDSESRVRLLIEAARSAGGSDNITVLVVSAPVNAQRRSMTTEPFDSARLTKELRARSRRKWWIPALAFTAGIIGATAVGWVVLRDSGPATPTGGGGGSGIPSAQTPRAALPVTSTAPADAAVGLPSLKDEPKSAVVKEQKPAAPVAPETPAKVITVPALKPRQSGDEAAVSDSKQVKKATRIGADASGGGSSKGKD